MGRSAAGASAIARAVAPKKPHPLAVLRGGVGAPSQETVTPAQFGCLWMSGEQAGRRVAGGGHAPATTTSPVCSCLTPQASAFFAAFVPLLSLGAGAASFAGSRARGAGGGGGAFRMAWASMCRLRISDSILWAASGFSLR